MLRITLPVVGCPELYVLEGKLTGLWARELLRVARTAVHRNLTVFDLRDVYYVDSTGEETLRILSGFGAKFIAESAYGKDLCSRLKLRRVAGSGVEGRNGNRPEGSRNSRRRPTAHAGQLDTFTAADANQHPSSFGQ